jgi:uncharacterized protein (TIGR03435 family)
MNRSGMLAITCAFALAATVSQAQSEAAKLPSFEVASVKQNMSETAPVKLAFTSDGVTIENATLLNIIRAAYGMFNSVDEKFIGVPNWAKTDRFDIEAKVDGADAARFQKLNFDQRQLMVQALLADRFGLRTHHEDRTLPVYLLVIAKSGPRLQESKPVEGADPGGTLKRDRGQITGQNVVISQLVTALTRTLGRNVIDKTERLPGKYDFTLRWSPDEGETQESHDQDVTPPSTNASGPSIFTAIQEQLGLKLEPGKGPVDCLVVDHLARPSEN